MPINIYYYIRIFFVNNFMKHNKFFMVHISFFMKNVDNFISDMLIRRIVISSMDGKP